MVWRFAWLVVTRSPQRPGAGTAPLRGPRSARSVAEPGRRGKPSGKARRTSPLSRGDSTSWRSSTDTRLLAAGYRDSTAPNGHPHRKRVYFHDVEGDDWEFVEYRSDDPAGRKDYRLPGAPRPSRRPSPA